MATVRIMLHDAAAGGHMEVLDTTRPDPPSEGQIEHGVIRIFRQRNYLYNSPPIKGIEKRLEVRINNALLATPVVDDGWLVFHDVEPKLFAVGNNLVGVVLEKCAAGSVESILIEKLEVHVKYK